MIKIIKSIILINSIVQTTTNSMQSFSGFSGNSELYTGPSSYTTSFGDYPGYGNYGSNLNTNNPIISSSYSSFGPSSESNNFGSTTYVNYPPSYEQQASQYIFNRPASGQSNPFQSYNSGSSSYSEQNPISQHVEVTKPIAVPIYKKFPYPKAQKFNVAVPHPIIVPVPAPYPINVAISQPVAVPIFKEIRIPIEKEVLYAVERKVPVTVDKPVQYQVEKHFPVYVPKPYPVKVPIIKTVIHKAPKKW